MSATVSCLNNAAVTPELRPPSLHNQSKVQWERAGQIAYLFARHARHDMANVHCGLNLIDVVHAMQQQCPDEPLPEELQPERLQIKIRSDLKHLMSISNDLVLLSQSASPAAYRGARNETLANLIGDAVLARLGPETIPGGLSSDSLQTIRVIALGDMLEAALSTFFFQWTPHCQPLNHVLHALVKPHTEHNRSFVDCWFPLEQGTLTPQGVERMQALDAALPLPDIDNELTASTTEMALWLARNIVLIHGGSVRVEVFGTRPSVIVRLPVLD